MKKLDLRKDLEDLYSPSPKIVAIVDVPKMNFLMVDGSGDPNTSEDYKGAVEALFKVSYVLKFMIKKGGTDMDYAVMPLEGLWWADKVEGFIAANKENWSWTSMIMQPDFITKDRANEAIESVIKKGVVSAQKIRFKAFTEGTCAQIMHIGSFLSEGPSLEKVHKTIQEKGFKLSGKHHEIYLSDYRKVAQERMRTVLRQPFSPNP